MTTGGTIKIFVDAHVFDNEHQGSRTFIKELYTALAANNQMQLYIAAYNTAQLKQEFPASANIEFIKYKNKNSIARLLFDIPMLIKKHQVDYAHFQYITPLKKSCRFIVTTHDVLFNDFPEEFSFGYRKLKNYLYKTAAKKADVLTTVSDHSKKSIQKYFGIAPQHIHVLAHGVNEKFFAPYNKQHEKIYLQQHFGFNKFILFVSRFEPRKNHAVVLKAFIELQLFQLGYHLVFIGHKSIKTPELDNLLQAMPASLHNYVQVLHNISDQELEHFYKAADVFVYPSKAEGFGMPPLEAAALQIPVLCSNAAALSDFKFFGDQLIDITDYTGFKHKLTGIINNGCSTDTLGNIAAVIQQRYCWKNTASRFYRLLQQNSTA